MQRVVECHEREPAEINIQEASVGSKDANIEENEQYGSSEVKAELSCGADVACSVESGLLVNSVEDDDAKIVILWERWNLHPYVMNNRSVGGES